MFNYVTSQEISTRRSESNITHKLKFTIECWLYYGIGLIIFILVKALWIDIYSRSKLIINIGIHYTLSEKP